MKKHSLLALALVLSLGACASIKNPIGNSTLATVVSTYGVAQSAAIAYMGLPRCTKTAPLSATNYCAARSIKVRIQIADQKANKAVNDAVTFTANNPTLDASSLINAAQIAVSTLQDLEKTAGVSQ